MGKTYREENTDENKQNSGETQEDFKEGNR